MISPILQTEFKHRKNKLIVIEQNIIQEISCQQRHDHLYRANHEFSSFAS